MLTMLRTTGLAAIIALCPPGLAFAQQCDIKDIDTFGPAGSTQERIHLVNRDGGAAEADDLIIFRAKLRVNTDGAPTSYSPTDLTGTVNAINNICNGVSVRRTSNGRTLACADARAVFANFRDANWREPAGFTIRWQNVLAARAVDGRQVPCVFQDGPNKGYFGSLTTLRNGLGGSAAGECLVNDQIDHRHIPALVLPGGDNALRRFGARIGDLAIAHNPATGVTQAAILADSGPADNLGEGSVALNMALLQRSEQPKTYREAQRLDTGDRQILVVIIPRSAGFERQRPYSAQNISARVTSWLASHGYGEQAGLAQAIDPCAPR